MTPDERMAIKALIVKLYESANQLCDPYGSARSVEKIDHPVVQSYLDDMKLMMREGEDIGKVADELTRLAGLEREI